MHDLAFLRDASWHGDQAQELAHRTKAAIAQADALIVPSTTTAQDVGRFAPDAPPTIVIPFGADHVPTAALPNPMAGRPYVLSLGTIEPRKNHQRLLAAWRRLPQPRPLLIIVGAIGWACDEIVADLQVAEQEGMVQWRRQCDDAELWPLLQNAQALAYPSLWEGFGFPPLEAMALGVPVVAHDSAPLRELGDGALTLANASEDDALAAALDRVLNDDDHRQRHIAAGRARARAFVWRDCAEAHGEWYREVAT